MADRTGKRVVVVGAGIVGASLAYHLARKGAQVTLVEAAEPASGVTGRSFAWINTAHAGNDPIARLRGAAIEDYHRLEAELPELQIRWSGALSWGTGAEDEPSSPTWLSRAEILEREPNLRHPPRQASYNAEEGALDAVQTTRALVVGAQAHGATVFTQTRVSGFTFSGADVTGIETTAGPLAADVIVLAAGTGTVQLAEMLDVSLPIDASPAIFIRFKTQADRLNGIISSPKMEVRQDADGALLAAEDYLGNAPHNQPDEIARRTAQVIQHELHGVTSIELQSACVGLRPVPVDGVPVVGYLPTVGGVYVCAMHPGVTLAAIVGRLASEEIVSGIASVDLGNCRPGRF